MAKTSSNRSSSSSRSSASSGAGRGKGSTGRQPGASSKGLIKEEFLRKKDELFKLKSLDIFLMKNVMGTNPKKSDMKPELKSIVKRLKAKKLKTT